MKGAFGVLAFNKAANRFISLPPHVLEKPESDGFVFNWS